MKFSFSFLLKFLVLSIQFSVVPFVAILIEMRNAQILGRFRIKVHRLGFMIRVLEGESGRLTSSESFTWQDHHAEQHA